jgi:hypothetical protein
VPEVNRDGLGETAWTGAEVSVGRRPARPVATGVAGDGTPRAHQLHAVDGLQRPDQDGGAHALLLADGV